MIPHKKLPIGIQTFREILEGHYYYVDKTDLAVKLVNEGKHYFLSRPRRFGKSLFLDTLKELFEGNKPLFSGLAAEQQWDWTVKYPVLRISFGSGNFRDADDLPQSLSEQLTVLEQEWGLSSLFETPLGRFKNLIKQAEQKMQQPVVILIDEYDKPILDALDYHEVARVNRDFLRGFYATIKDYDAHIKFSFLTGVSKFSKVSLFSGLNNLYDLTLDPKYSAICGYTDQDVDRVFAPELTGLERDEIRSWYNGYNWLGEGVYNPFDILQLFRNRKFRNYWFETVTPTFLIQVLQKARVSTPQLNQLLSTEELLSSFDIETIAIEALMFQTGYLTIKQVENLDDNYFYTLGYPNREVYQSLNSSLLQYWSEPSSAPVVNRKNLYQALMINDFERLQVIFQAFFASIPHQWYDTSKGLIAHYEGFYASVFYSHFAALGMETIVEDSSSLGRLDMAVKFNRQIYLFEFKVLENSGEGKALAQLKAKHYADKYRALNQPIYLIGVEFSKEQRNVVGFEVEQG